MQLEDIRALVADDLRRVDQVIVDRLASDVVLVNQISQYIIGGGGKRLRPLSVLLAARACGYTGHHHVEAAAIIEFIHTATLPHDDVVDASSKRRGRDTTNHVFGNQASVLVGDYLYSRSFQMMVSLDDLRIQGVMADATNTMAMKVAAHGIKFTATATIGYHADLKRKVKRACELEGPCFIHVLAPCPTGWRHDSADTVALSRLAVETGIFILWELEGKNLKDIKLSRKPKVRKPVIEYLKAQGRFRHLLKQPEVLAQIQKDVDEQCAQFGF